MGSLASIFALLACVVLVSSCGGGGGNNSGGGVSTSSAPINSSSAVSNNRIDSSSSSKSSSSQPVVIEDPLWKDAGSLGSSVLLLSGDNANTPKYIQKIDPDGIIKTLTPKLVEGGSIKRMSLSPDNKKIIYLADQEIDGTDEIFIMNIDGSFNRKISRKLSGKDIYWAWWSPDSNYFMFSESESNNNFKHYLQKFNDPSPTEVIYKNVPESSYKTLSVDFSKIRPEYTYIASNGFDSHVVTVEIESGAIKKDLVIDKKLGTTDTISPSGKYISLKSYEYSPKIIYNNETHQETSLSLGDRTAWWLITDDKLITHTKDEVTIYTTSEATDKVIISLEGIELPNPTTFSWKSFIKDSEEYIFFSFGDPKNWSEVYLHTLRAGTTSRLKDVLGVNERISSHQLSPNGKLLALTETNNLYTLNLEGSEVQHFDYLKTTDEISNIDWTSDSSGVIFMQRHSENDVESNLIKTVDLSTGITKTVSIDKIPTCLLVESTSSKTCAVD